MSRTEIYAVDAEGNIEFEGECQNAWLGAMHVWKTLASKYGIVKPGEEYRLLLDDSVMKQIWALARDERLPWWERVVHASTFDRAIVLRDDFPRLIEAFEQWVRERPEEAIGLACQLDYFKLIVEHERGFRGICWNQTTIGESYWWVRDGSGEDEEGRQFNIDRDAEWWSLFEKHPELRNPCNDLLQGDPGRVLVT